jgi:hypothetical protein
LKSFPGVTNVVPRADENNIVSWEVDTLDGQDLREPITKKLIEQGFGVRRVDILKHTLQEMFTNLVLRRD